MLSVNQVPSLTITHNVHLALPALAPFIVALDHKHSAGSYLVFFADMGTDVRSLVWVETGVSTTVENSYTDIFAPPHKGCILVLYMYEILTQIWGSMKPGKTA